MRKINYPSDIDKEMIPLLDALNSIRGVKTRFTCCGHGRKCGEFYIYMEVSNLKSLKMLYNVFDCYIDINKIDMKTWYVKELSETYDCSEKCIGLRISNEAFNYLKEPDRKHEYNILISRIMIFKDKKFV